MEPVKRWYVDCSNCGWNGVVVCDSQPRECDQCGKPGSLMAWPQEDEDALAGTEAEAQ